ncbi:MAG: LCP family protein [Mogibacterium sp.]|nr:LCP family protein [Mogibacterium sp.]
MTLKEEIKDIYDNRPTPEERKKEKLEAGQSSAYKRGRRGLTAEDPLRPAARRAYMILTLLLALAAAAFFVMLIVINPLPADLTIVVSILILGLLTASALLFRKRRKWKRIAGFVPALTLVLIVALGMNFMVNTYAMLNRIVDSGVSATGPAAKTVDVVNEPFNIYITGIDQWAYEKGMDLERSDVNMIITVNPVTKKVLITSIPRDTYVELYTARQMDKLTHTGVYGVDETLNTVEKWLGVKLNYYVKMNFTGARDIINAMDGIEVYSPVAFESSLAGYEYQKGWNFMYGKKALYFARERHAFEGMDSVRVENQQRVVEAIIKKMTSSRVLLTKYGDIMDAAGEQMSTNISTDEMTALAKMQISELASWDVEMQKIEGKYDQDYVASLTQSRKFDVYRPDPASVRSCVDNIDSVMNPSLSELSEARKNASKSFFVNAVKRLAGGGSGEEEPENGGQEGE